VIQETAEEVMELHGEGGGAQVSELPPPAAGWGRRASAEVTEIYKGLGQRRFTLARETALINDITARTSIDLGDEEIMLPRTRSGSLFPVSAFVDDFAQAQGCRSRSGSLMIPLIPPKALPDLYEVESQE